jgi:hypothetical protein
MKQNTNAMGATDNKDKLSGLARSLRIGAWYDCKFEQLSDSRVIVHFPDNMTVATQKQLINGLREHIKVTHLNAGSVYMETDSETFN